MLNVYLDKRDVPSGIKVQDFNDMLFDTNVGKINIDKNVVSIIKSIENADYLGDFKVKSKYGIIVDILEISTGCKAAINIYSFPDKFINCIECGDNALHTIFRFNRGNIVCKFAPSYTNYKVPVDIMLHHNGKTKHCTTLEETIDNWNNWR